MIRTIIVDDEILSRIGIKSMIDGKDEIVVSGIFGDAKEAVEFLKTNPVDVVLTDIEMADMNGLEFIREIRENSLAAGVIIISCHDNFAYAQEAISRGTDSYVLKHNVTQEMLIQEIKKVYNKRVNESLQLQTSRHLCKKSMEDFKSGIYRIGVLRLKTGTENFPDEEQQPEGTMLTYLLEGIADRYQMGTVFSPYNKEVFIVFQFEKDSAPREREERLQANLDIISKNMQQYINGCLIYGISPEFTDLRETRERYGEAVTAAEMSFYHGENCIFYYKENQEEPLLDGFSTEYFMDTEGLERFAKELREFLSRASFYRLPVSRLKERLIQSINRMMYHILEEYHFEEDFHHKWKSEAPFISAITGSKDAGQLEEKLLELVGRFYEEIQAEINKDDFTKVLQYIDQNFKEKITLTELAERSCMSVPSFCKKFKERTGMTLVQYMNEIRIDKARALLKSQNYSLWQIAEMTGFSNTNYLIRVFKKVTGQTVSEYTQDKKVNPEIRY